MNMSVSHLGYDPQPECNLVRGTPIPSVLSPLQWTERRAQIAEQVWWNGPPWTVLRNAHVYLYQVLDYANEEDLCFTRKDVPKSIWCDAIRAANPSDLSAGAYTLEGLLLGLHPIGFKSGWSITAHIQDCRPLANATREELYKRHASYAKWKAEQKLLKDETDALNIKRL